VLRLYNTLTRSVEPFHPLAPPAVTIYVCGPTVYDDPHIGHARSAYIFDLLRRYLESQKRQVRFVRNVTDVDDKIIEKARQELVHSPQSIVHSELKAKCAEVAQRYLTSYHATMDRLGIQRPDVEPRATERVVPDMTDFISTLLLQGAAYEAQGDVYFAVRKFPGYGKLSNRALDDLQAGARVEPGEHKQDPLDFALWKAAKPDEPSWKSPWGPGRPGWHIECSAMSTKELGDAFDIHGGGVDLVFPHHENEIAQAQAAGKPFATYWVHNGLLTVNGDKMSKSLGNFVTVDTALKACRNEPDILKIFFLGAHYRSPIDYSEKAIEAAGMRWYGLSLLLEYAHHEAERLRGRSKSSLAAPQERVEVVSEIENEFAKAMDDDFNTPQALASLDKLVRLSNEWRKEIEGHPRTNPTEEDKDRHAASVVLAAKQLRRLSEVLGLTGLSAYQPVPSTPELQAKLDEREEARRSRNFKKADAIRDELRKQGIEVEDTSFGPIPRRKR